VHYPSPALCELCRSDQGYYDYACLRDYDTAVRYFEQARQFLQIAVGFLNRWPRSRRGEAVGPERDTALILPKHRHLLEMATQKIVCACDPFLENFTVRSILRFFLQHAA
jgi:hypothetical protein